MLELLKMLLKNLVVESTYIYSALLEYRVTPVAETEYSLSKIIMERLLRSELPCNLNKLKPKLIYQGAGKILLEQQAKYKYYYDRNAKF